MCLPSPDSSVCPPACPLILQTLRHELVPAELPRHTARLLQLLLARLRCWPAAGQLDLVAELKSLMFQASVAALFGPQFLGQKPGQGQAQVHPGSAAAAAAGASSGRAEALQEAFFTFEAGFEMAASPLPHLFQPRFLAARRRLVAALRCGADACCCCRCRLVACRTAAAQLLAPGIEFCWRACRACRGRCCCRESYRAGHFEGTVAGSLIVVCAAACCNSPSAWSLLPAAWPLAAWPPCMPVPQALCSPLPLSRPPWFARLCRQLQACGLPEVYVPNMLLAVLWASQVRP